MLLPWGWVKIPQPGASLDVTAPFPQDEFKFSYTAESPAWDLFFLAVTPDHFVLHNGNMVHSFWLLPGRSCVESGPISCCFPVIILPISNWKTELIPIPNSNFSTTNSPILQFSNFPHLVTALTASPPHHRPRWHLIVIGVVLGGVRHFLLLYWPTALQTQIPSESSSGTQPLANPLCCWQLRTWWNLVVLNLFLQAQAFDCKGFVV